MTAAYRPLLILGACYELLFLSLYSLEPLRELLLRRGTAHTSALYSHLLMLLLFFLGFYIYLLGSRRAAEGGVSRRTVFLSFILFNVTLIPLAPPASTDLYSYICQSRVLSVWGENPYLVPYDTFAEDLFFSHRTKWTKIPVIYGPLFVYVTSALSFLGKSSVAATFLLFKLFFFLVSLLNLFLLDRACRNTAVTFLYAWNPLTIIEGAGHGHVSIFLVCFLLAAYAAYHRGLFRATAGLAVWVFLLLAAMIKFTAALFLPFAGVSCLLSRYGRERWRSLVVLAAAAVAIPLLLYLPLWSGWEIFDAVHRASRLFNYNALPFIFLTAVFSAAGSGDPLALALKVVRWLFLASYLGLGVYFLREVVQRRSPSLFRYLFAVQGALIFWSSYIMPWYFYELFVLSLLAGSEGTVAQLRGRTLASVPLILTLLGIVFYAVQH